MSFKKHSGFAVPLTLLAAVCIALFSMLLMTMSRSYRTQVGHTDRRQASFKIAYSGYSTVLAKTWSQPWEQRFFKDSSGVIEQNLFGGRYEAFVHNSPGKENMFDVYVLTTLDDLNQLYFWRVERVTDMLNITGGFRTIWSTETSIENFPQSDNFPLAQEVNDLMAEREINRENAEEAARRISAVNDIRDIAKIIGARAPEFPTGDWPNNPEPFVSRSNEPSFRSINVSTGLSPPTSINDVQDYTENEKQTPLPPRCTDCGLLTQNCTCTQINLCQSCQQPTQACNCCVNCGFASALCACFCSGCESPVYNCACCIDCSSYPCICELMCHICNELFANCVCPEELCDSCGQNPCECQQMCPGCGQDPCACQQMCPGCEQDPCECSACTDCGQDPCACYVCGSCGQDPCKHGDPALCPFICDGCGYLSVSCTCHVGCPDCGQDPCECSACTDCGQDPCGCCASCGSLQCQPCTNCGQCDCVCAQKICSICNNAPCICDDNCCGICKAYPCVCGGPGCNKCGNRICDCPLCNDCGATPCVCPEEPPEGCYNCIIVGGTCITCRTQKPRPIPICNVCNQAGCVCCITCTSHPCQCCNICNTYPCQCCGCGETPCQCTPTEF